MSNPTCFSPANFSRGLSTSGTQALSNMMQLPCAKQGEYELSDHEIERLRRRIYDINKNHPRGYRFKTMRDGRLLLVWRIR